MIRIKNLPMYAICLLTVHSGEDKTKCILSTWDKNLPGLKVTYDNNRVKQNLVVKIPWFLC